MSYVNANIKDPKLLYYIALYSGLPTFSNNNKNKTGTSYGDITGYTNQQYPQFIMSAFESYTKVIILLDSDFEAIFEILKGRPAPDIFIESGYIKLYKFNKEFIFIIECTVEESDHQKIHDFVEYFIDRTITFNNKLVIQSFCDPLNLFIKFYEYLVKNNKHTDTTIFDNIMINFSPLRSYTHGNCFCNGTHRFKIDNSLFDISLNSQFIQYKLLSLHALLDIAKKNTDIKSLLYYYIIHIIESLNTILRYNYNTIYDCIKNNEENCLYLFIAYNITHFDKSVIIDILCTDLINCITYLLTETHLESLLLWKNDSDSYYFKSNLLFQPFYADQGYIFDTSFTFTEKFTLMVNILCNSIKINDKNYTQGLSNFKANLKDYFRNFVSFV